VVCLGAGLVGCAVRATSAACPRREMALDRAGAIWPLGRDRGNMTLEQKVWINRFGDV
jgi:hypothetical protein